MVCVYRKARLIKATGDCCLDMHVRVSKSSGLLVRVATEKGAGLMAERW